MKPRWQELQPLLECGLEDGDVLADIAADSLDPRRVGRQSGSAWHLHSESSSSGDTCEDQRLQGGGHDLHQVQGSPERPLDEQSF